MYIATQWDVGYLTMLYQLQVLCNVKM